MCEFTLPDTKDAAERLDNLFATAFGVDHPALQDWAAIKFAIKPLLTQSPAPSKEMDERIDEIVAREIAYESMQFWRDDLKKILTALAAELGKEREGDELFWKGEFNRYRTAFDEEQKLRLEAEAERDQLERELAEAHKWKDRHDIACNTITAMQVEREQRESYQVLSGLSSWLGQGAGDGTTSSDAYDKRIRAGVEFIISVERTRREQAETQLLALSVSYQRQKDLLKQFSEDWVAGTDIYDYFEQVRDLSRDALAETPDVSMLEKWQNLLKVAAETVKTDEEARAELQRLGIITDPSITEDLKTAVEALSTLQPDHQK